MIYPACHVDHDYERRKGSAKCLVCNQRLLPKTGNSGYGSDGVYNEDLTWRKGET